MAKVTTASLAARIKKTRIRAGMSQKQFSKKLGIKQGKLSEWENGMRLSGILDAMQLLSVITKK